MIVVDEWIVIASLVNIAAYTTTITLARHIRRYTDTHHMHVNTIHSSTTTV